MHSRSERSKAQITINITISIQSVTILIFLKYVGRNKQFTCLILNKILETKDPKVITHPILNFRHQDQESAKSLYYNQDKKHFNTYILFVPQ